MEDDTLGADTTTVVIFDELGQFTVTAWVMREALRDSVVWTVTVEVPDGVDPDRLSQPHSFYVDTPYPNPFNSTATIHYQLPSTEHVTLSVFDLKGRRIMTIYDGYSPAGSHRITMDGSGLSSETYIVKFTAGNRTFRVKAALIK